MPRRNRPRITTRGDSTNKHLNITAVGLEGTKATSDKFIRDEDGMLLQDEGADS